MPSIFSSRGEETSARPSPSSESALGALLSGGAFLLRSGMRVGQYELVKCIGQGGTGIVYEAVHSALGRRVALKILHTHAHGVDASKRNARFLREGRAAAQIRHPHVLDVYDFGVANDLTFLVMELVEGESLAQLLRGERKLRVERAVEVLLPILSAAAELHAGGIIHRDIKPANVLLARGPSVCPKLADFGVSRFDDGSPGITDSGAMLGTIEYMAPELIRAESIADERSDQYSLGVTLYECVTGQKPFQGSAPYDLMQAIVGAAVVAPSACEPSVPVSFDDVVLRAMHRDPAQRFSCIDDLAEALLPFATEAVAAQWRSPAVFSTARFDDHRGSALRRPVPANFANRRWLRRSAVALVAGAGLVILVSLAVAVANKSPARSDRVKPAGAHASVALGASAPTVSVALAVSSPPDPVDPAASKGFLPVDLAAGAPLPARTPPPAVATATPIATISTPAPLTKIVGPRVKTALAAMLSGAPLPEASTTPRGENGAPILDVP